MQTGLAIHFHIVALPAFALARLRILAGYDCLHTFKSINVSITHLSTFFLLRSKLHIYSFNLCASVYARGSGNLIPEPTTFVLGEQCPSLTASTRSRRTAYAMYIGRQTARNSVVYDVGEQR